MNNLELHYYLEDDSHSMNAIAKNKAEAELIRLFLEVSNILELEIELEFEALKQGGIKEIVKYFKKKKNKQKLEKLLIYLGAILSGVLINVISDHYNKDKELDELTKEEKRLNIRKLKNELEKDSLSKEQETILIETIIVQVSDTHKVQVFKSRFYKNILNEPKIYQF